MRSLCIGRTVLAVKDYECSQDEEYIPKKELRLWLYVQLTNSCNAACSFCVNAANPSKGCFDVSAFSKTLTQIEPYVSGISLTGGEPMLDIPLLEEVVAAVDAQIDRRIELDLVTNGTELNRLPNLRGLDQFATIHISRHASDDAANRRLMGWRDAPSAAEMASVIRNLPDPGCIVLNCILQKKGVHDLESASEYLEMAASIGAANVSFIGMFQANDYCREHYVSPAALGLYSDARYAMWNHFQDYEYCQCSTGDYKAKDRYIRFYYRCPGAVRSPNYCRQLVYGPDHALRQGFGKAPEVLL